MNRYEESGQRLYSQNWSEEYKENYEKIFGKKETWLERREREQKEVELKPCPNKEGGCFCTGKCMQSKELDDNCPD